MMDRPQHLSRRLGMTALGVIALLLVVDTSLGIAPQPSTGPPVAEESAFEEPLTCSSSAEHSVVAVSPEEVEATLQELYAQFRGLPGFIDVYFRPVAGVQYRPLFLKEVPPAALSIQTRIPVDYDVIAEEPQPTDPGPVPSALDLRCSSRVRPGARMGNGCTLSFLFTDGANTYAGTAGHCVAVGQAITVDGISGVSGTVVFSTGNAGVGNDFALIQISALALPFTTPEMCDWAGPTGTNTAVIGGKRIVHTGHGQYVGVVGGIPPRPRVYVGDGWGATSFDWFGGAIGGDSGSAIRLAAETAPSQGKALGTVTHSLGVVVGTPTIGFGTRWDRGIALAAAGGFPGLSLLTVAYVHPI